MNDSVKWERWVEALGEGIGRRHGLKVCVNAQAWVRGIGDREGAPSAGEGAAHHSSVPSNFSTNQRA